jgi:DNA invertase Pin-like site-specific DNA recombinase
VRDSDVLIVTKLDRLARSVPNLCEIGQRLDGKGVGLKVLDQAIDTTTPTGRLIFNMLGAIAQFERELIRERMLVGIAKAKAEGKYRGRAPTARMQAEKVRQLKAAGVGPSEIARQLGIGRTSVFRILTAA